MFIYVGKIFFEKVLRTKGFLRFSYIFDRKSVMKSDTEFDAKNGPGQPRQEIEYFI